MLVAESIWHIRKHPPAILAPQINPAVLLRYIRGTYVVPHRFPPVSEGVGETNQDITVSPTVKPAAISR